MSLSENNATIFFGEIMNTIEDLEIYAKRHFVPIARKATISFMINLIKENNYKSFLEIGTAIGYTSIVLAKEFKNFKILTIEHDGYAAKRARDNFKDFKVEEFITLVEDDAVNYEVDGLYDLIFIDAAKKKNWFFLEKFSNNLSDNGTIIVDNMNLDDFWINANKDKKAEYDRVNKEFKEFVLTSDKYDATLYNDIGDGIVVIKLKK